MQSVPKKNLSSDCELLSAIATVLLAGISSLTFAASAFIRMTEILSVNALPLGGDDVLEYSVHSVPKAYRSTFKDMFPVCRTVQH